tara:strand:- start:24502 stop:30339 length:5838 start_codon:yes stop_codon:yes gene_type:complete
MVLSGSATTVEDVLERFSAHINTPEDVDVVTRSFNHAQQSQARYQQSLTTTPEKFLAALGSKRNITVYGLTALSSAPDLLGFIRDIRAPQLPPGTTIEDMRTAFSLAGVPTEMSAQFMQEAEDFSLVISRELDTLSTRAAIWEADIINAIDNGTFAQQMSEFKEGLSFFDNPGLYIGLPLDWMDKNYWKPVGGIATRVLQESQRVGVPVIPALGGISTQIQGMASFFGLTPEHYLEFEAEYALARADGESIWHAYGVAFENLDTNAVSKIIVELVADPTTYLGFGVAKIFKPIPLLYPAIRTMETGWMRITNLPFVALQKGLGTVIPKLPGQIAARDAFRSIQVVADYLNAAPPQSIPFQQQSMTRNREHMQLALETLQANPHHSGTITDAARTLLERPMITPDEATSLLGKLGSAISDADLHQFTSDLDMALSHSRALPGGMSHVPEETIELILGFAAAPRNDTNIRAVSDLIRRQRQQALTRYDSIINAGDVREFIDNIIRHRRFVLEANQRNPVSAYRNRFAMLMTSMATHNRTYAAATTIASALDLANRFSYGFTRMYLMSTMYGPYNIFEAAAKSVALRINPFYRGSQIRELQATMMGFETLAPDIFLTADVFLPQAQNIATAGATAQARDRGTRQAFRRIWGSNQNVLRKLYSSADQVFIQTGARVGLEQAAHVLNALAKRHLFDNSRTGPIARRVSEQVSDRAVSLRPHMAPRMVEIYKQEMFRRAIQNPESLTAMSTEFIPGFGHAAEVQEMLAKYTTLDPGIREHLVDLTINQDLFRLLNTGELDTRITEAIWQQIFAEPEVYLARIRELTRAVLDIPPTTLEDLRVQTLLLEDLTSSTVHTIEQQMSATQAYTREMRSLTKKNDVWQGQWDNIIQPIMAAGEDASRQVVESLRKALREQGFNLPQQSINQYDDLIHKQLLRMQLTVKARNSINDFTQLMLNERDNEIIPRIRRAGNKPNSDHPEIRDWWARFNSGRDRIWRETSAELAESAADISSIAGSLDAFPLPHPKDVSTRPIVMADVAYLYGASPDSVTQGMYLADLKMMRPKAEWVNVVYAQARRVAKQTGGDPDALGYSKSRLGSLYDQQLNALKLNPAVANLSAPRFREWHALHVELQSYAQASSIVIKPGAEEALDGAARGLLDDIGADPLTREVVEPLVRPTAQPTVVYDSPAGARLVASNPVLGEAGGPTTIFHGTPFDFPGRQLTMGRGAEGIWFTNSEATARRFGSIVPSQRAPEGAVVGTGQVLSRTVREDASVLVINSWDGTGSAGLAARGRKAGADIIAIRRVSDVPRTDAQYYLVLNPDVMQSPGQQVSTAWTGKRRESFKAAVDEYNLNFPVYDQANAINAGMRFIFPFWTYEAHRWSYLPRIALRNPGLTHAWGLYNDNTDRGYVPIPGTSLQGNFLRNSIMMGGLQRWVNRDFPEFYDQYPDLANVLDQMGRVGFYPNPYVSGLMASPLMNKAGIWQTGELIPPPIGSALEAIIAADPDNQFADALANIILPNRFRDYRVALRMAQALPDGQGARASDILLKRLQGQELTEEEKQIWDSAERRSSLDSIVDYQIGLFRLRPEELTASRELAKQIILQHYPISEAQYDEARKLGMPLEQYYAPFSPELTDALRAVDEISRWRGLASHLGESNVAQMLQKQRDYWNRVEARRDDALARELELDRQFRMTGPDHITRNDWLRQKQELDTEMHRFIEDLKASPDFTGVPIEFDDRVEFANTHNTLAPVQHPIEEMVTYYFGKTPDDFRFFDPELGAMTTDWDGFFKWRTTLENSLEGANQQAFLDRIHRWDTDLDTSRRQDYEGFIRPYRALFDLTMVEFSDAEQAVIRQFYSTDSIAVRQELQEVMRGELKVVSTFQRTLSERRRRMRMLDPETDARLAFWGETTSVTSTNAQAIHDSLYPRYGIQEREVIAVSTVDPFADPNLGLTP